MKVSTENDNNFGYEKITIVVDNIPLKFAFGMFFIIGKSNIFIVALGPFTIFNVFSCF
jgi:hypothetical protein